MVRDSHTNKAARMPDATIRPVACAPGDASYEPGRVPWVSTAGGHPVLNTRVGTVPKCRYKHHTITPSHHVCHTGTHAKITTLQISSADAVYLKRELLMPSRQETTHVVRPHQRTRLTCTACAWLSPALLLPSSATDLLPPPALYPPV